MLPELTAKFAAIAGPGALTAALVGVAGGTFLWLTGARFSRSLLTLVGVAVGAAVGRRLPGWFDWPVDGMAVGFAAALVLGVGAYVLHTTCVGAWLAVAMAAAAGSVAWALLAEGARSVALVPNPSASLTDNLNALWQSLPGALPRVMPCAIAGGLAAGVALTVLWPRFVRVLACSMTGALVLLVTGLTALSISRPASAAAFPSTAIGQLALAAGLVMIGVLVQLWTTPSVSTTPAGHAKKSKE